MNVRRWAGGLAIVVAAATTGYALSGTADGIAGGEAKVQNGALYLGTGALYRVGTGRSTDVVASLGGQELDVLFGDPTGKHLIGHFGAVAGLYRQDFSIVGTELPARWQAAATDTLSMRCDNLLELSIDNRRMVVTGPEGCGSSPVWLRAGGPVVVKSITLDGKPAPITAERFALRPAVGVATGCLAAGLFLGIGNLFPLLFAPLALLAPRLGLPMVALAALLAGACGLQAAIARSGWRRGLGGLLAVGAMGAAAWSVVPHGGPGEDAWDGGRPAFAAVDKSLVERKVAAGVDAFRKQKLPDRHPRLVAMGSSSSGGGTAGRFWPQVLQERLPEMQVVSVAMGGSTTWHMRRIFETLDLRPEYCVFYMGHNDRMPSFPGLTIAELMRGAPARGNGWQAPVTLEEARGNIEALVGRCGVFLGMVEYARGRDKELGEYVEMMRTIPGVHYADAAGLLRSLPASAMIDDVHPSPSGQEALGKFVDTEIRRLMASPGATPGASPGATSATNPSNARATP